MHRLELKLDANGVVAPAQRAAWQCSEIITFSLQSAAAADLSKQPEIVSNTMRYSFTGPPISAEERFKIYENWLLAKGFQDLARGIRETLEEAVFYLEMMKYQPGKTTVGEFNEHIAAIRRRAGRLQFPELMAEVNAGLKSPMAFEGEFLLLQKVRNCLEHRAGIVGEVDLNEPGKLTLILPRLKMFYMHQDQEVELEVGAIIDTHEHEGLAKGAEILLKHDVRTRSYDLGQQVAFDSKEFSEIAFACHLFAADIGSKLPTLAAAEPSSAYIADGSNAESSNQT